MNFCIILLSVFNLYFKQPPVKYRPDYRAVCRFIEQDIGINAGKNLRQLLGKQSLESLVSSMGRAAKDSINKYANPLGRLRLGGPYGHRQLDSAFIRNHIYIRGAIARFIILFSNKQLSLNKRVFALQVLIGLETAVAAPAHVFNLPPWQQFIKKDLFLDDTLLYGFNGKLINYQNYYAYLLGTRMAQMRPLADSAYFIDKGYRSAGAAVEHDIYGSLIPKWQFHSPHLGMIISSENDTIYTKAAMAFFPGGDNKLVELIKSHLQYPFKEWDKGIEGTFQIVYIVEKDGSLSHIRIQYFSTPGIDSAILKAMEYLPKWIPARVKGIGPPVRSQWFFDIDFKIKPGVKRENAFKAPPIPN